MSLNRRVLPFPGSLGEVPGIRVGHAMHSRRPTGCTVVLCEAGAVAGVDVRGAAPGTRECDLLAPSNLVDRVHAVLLSGGSAFGLDAASGVMAWLDEHGHGLEVGPARVPIVPAAVLFDLTVGDPRIRPDAALGRLACANAAASAPGSATPQGCVGSGAGATLGKMFGMAHAMKGGVGSASLTVGAVTVAALVAVNALGDVLDPRDGRLLAGARDDEGKGLRGTLASLMRGEGPAQVLAGVNTTLGVVATDAVLTKPLASRIATMAHDGLARSIQPIHTFSDGDVIFALATGASGVSLNPSVLGALAAEVTARAVVNAIWAAQGLPGLPSAHELGTLARG